MKEARSRLNKKKLLLYSTLLTLIFSGNSFVVAKDVTVSSGTELNNRLESYISPRTIEDARAQGDRHASGAIIANSIQACQGSAIIKSSKQKLLQNSLILSFKLSRSLY